MRLGPPTVPWFLLALACACGRPEEDAADAPPSLRLARDADGIHGAFEDGTRSLGFETKRVLRDGDSRVVARVLDPKGDAIAVDVSEAWSTAPDRSPESFTREAVAERRRLLELLPAFRRALADAAVPPGRADDVARLTTLVELGGRAPSRKASLAIQGSFARPRDASSWYGLDYEIHTKPAFVDVRGNPAEHSSMLVWNKIFDASTGEETIADYFVYPPNRGTSADAPSMTLRCSKFVPDRWAHSGSFHDECPGTNGEGTYLLDGVCNNSTYFQKLVLEGVDELDAKARACDGPPRVVAPGCDE